MYAPVDEKTRRLRSLALAVAAILFAAGVVSEFVIFLKSGHFVGVSLADLNVVFGNGQLAPRLDGSWKGAVLLANAAFFSVPALVYLAIAMACVSRTDDMILAAGALVGSALGCFMLLIAWIDGAPFRLEAPAIRAVGTEQNMPISHPPDVASYR